MSKRQESGLLVDTMIEEENRCKRQRMQNTHDSFARKINLLAVKEGDLQHRVQNLQWKKKTLEDETRELEVKQALVKMKAITSTAPTVPPCQDFQLSEVMHRSFPSPSLSTVSTFDHCLDSPPSTPRQPICPLPLPSSYEPFLQNQDNYASPINTVRSFPTPEKSQPPPYIPPYIQSIPPDIIDLYVPTPIIPSKPTANNPIKQFKDRSEAYWRRFEIAIQQRGALGKRRWQNPEDLLWFELFLHPCGRVRVRLNGKFEDIQSGCNQANQ